MEVPSLFPRQSLRDRPNYQRKTCILYRSQNLNKDARARMVPGPNGEVLQMLPRFLQFCALVFGHREQLPTPVGRQKRRKTTSPRADG